MMSKTTEYFLDIDGNKVGEGDSVELIDGGEVFAKGKVVELDAHDGVTIRAEEFGEYKDGNAIFISPVDVIPRHFRKIRAGI